MAITLVAAPTLTVAQQQSTITQTYTQTTTSGNILVTAICWISGTGTGATTPTAVTDAGTNTWTLVPAAQEASGATANYASVGTAFAYVTNCVGKATHAVSVAFTLQTNVWIAQYELTPGLYDQASVGTGSGTAASCASLTPSANGAFIIAACTMDDSFGSGSLFAASGQTSGYSIGLNSGQGNYEVGTEHLAQTTAAAGTSPITLVRSAGTWVESQVSFTPPIVADPNTLRTLSSPRLV